jgi:hypothetical protein
MYIAFWQSLLSTYIKLNLSLSSILSFAFVFFLFTNFWAVALCSRRPPGSGRPRGPEVHTQARGSRPACWALAASTLRAASAALCVESFWLLHAPGSGPLQASAPFLPFAFRLFVFAHCPCSSGPVPARGSSTAVHLWAHAARARAPLPLRRPLSVACPSPQHPSRRCGAAVVCCCALCTSAPNCCLRLLTRAVTLLCSVSSTHYDC